MSEQYLYIVGVDGSDPSRRAVEFAARHAVHSGATLLLAHIVSWSGFTPISVSEAMRRPLDKKEEEKIAREKVLAPLAAVAREITGTEPDLYHSWGHPAQVLKKLGRERGAEMIIVGRRGHSSIAEIFMGSVSNAIAHASDVPVVLVP